MSEKQKRFIRVKEVNWNDIGWGIVSFVIFSVFASVATYPFNSVYPYYALELPHFVVFLFGFFAGVSFLFSIMFLLSGFIGKIVKKEIEYEARK